MNSKPSSYQSSSNLKATDVCKNLHAELTPDDKEHLEPFYEQAVAVGSMSAQELYSSLISAGKNSPAFKPLLCYFNEVEGSCGVTYNDAKTENRCPSDEDFTRSLQTCYPTIYRKGLFQENHMSAESYGCVTLGIGLNLNISSSKAVVLTVRPSIDFEELKTNFGEPHPPMSQDEIEQMFLLTLTGASYDGTTYDGVVPQLIQMLKSNQLDIKPFPFNQLVALVSLTFNGEALIGPNLKTALEKDDTLGALIQIVEESNKEDNIGLANRRVKDGGMYYNLDGVYIPWREYAELCMSSESGHYPPHYLSTLS